MLSVPLMASGACSSSSEEEPEGVGYECLTPSASQIDSACFPDELPSPAIGTPQTDSDISASLNVEFSGPFVRRIDGVPCVLCNFLSPKPVDTAEFYNCDQWYRCGDDACGFHVAIGGYDERVWLVFGPAVLSDAAAAEFPAGCDPWRNGSWELGPADIAPWQCEPSCVEGVCGDDGCGQACPCGSTSSSSSGDGACSACYDACAGIAGCSCCAECGVACYE